ncbi:MAG: HNH endonuclease [Acidobacteria bacterium]|nr:HNH endonuclease [Acidobacteriota bacterium]
MSEIQDPHVRLAAFEWLRHQIDIRGDDVLPWKLIAQGFEFKGRRVPLVSQQGIFKPAVCDLPISIRTSLKGPYDDSQLDAQGRFRYAYRGTDPAHRDNAGLRLAMERRVPLIYFFGVVEGRYLTAFPVYVEHDDPGELAFTIAVDDASSAGENIGDEIDRLSVAEPEAESRRIYVTGTFRRRLHQRSFRERVLAAYRRQCALCRPRHEELLEAAHIIPDSERGEPVVSNGLSLCKIHHAAYDRGFIGVRPDRIVEVRSDLLEEEDGPMLRHGLQGMHGQRIHIPRRAGDQPDPEALARRYARFVAGA